MGKKIICVDTNEVVRKYNDYLNTKHWKQFRKLKIAEQKSKCQICGKKKKSNLHVHHLNYDCLGNETLEDVMCLCEKCHKQLHKGKSVPELKTQKKKEKQNQKMEDLYKKILKLPSYQQLVIINRLSKKLLEANSLSEKPVEVKVEEYEYNPQLHYHNMIIKYAKKKFGLCREDIEFYLDILVADEKEKDDIINKMKIIDDPDYLLYILGKESDESIERSLNGNKKSS